MKTLLETSRGQSKLRNSLLIFVMICGLNPNYIKRISLPFMIWFFLVNLDSNARPP